MSYTRSSALRWFEALVKDTRERVRVASKKLSMTKILENAINLGDIVFPKIVHSLSKLAEIISKLQITMIESMIMASMWYGLALLLLVTIVILTR